MGAGTGSEMRVEENESPMLLVGRDHKISYANPPAHRLFGYLHGALYGLPIDKLVPQSRRGELKNLNDVLSGQAGRKLRSLARRADGHNIDVTLTLEPCLDVDGDVVAVSLRYQSLPKPHPARAGGIEPNAIGIELPIDGSSLPPPLHSEVRATRSRAACEVADQLSTVVQLLRWLDERFAAPVSEDPADEARERTRARVVLSEARGLVEECQRELRAFLPEEIEIPAAPRLPR